MLYYLHLTNFLHFILLLIVPTPQVKEGDVVTVGQCRPLSKTVRFNVLKVESATEAGAARAKKTFRVF